MFLPEMSFGVFSKLYDATRKSVKGRIVTLRLDIPPNKPLATSLVYVALLPLKSASVCTVTRRPDGTLIERILSLKVNKVIGFVPNEL